MRRTKSSDGYMAAKQSPPFARAQRLRGMDHEQSITRFQGDAEEAGFQT